MALEIVLPTRDGALEKYSLSEPANYQPPREPFRARVAYSAAHVVADALASYNLLADVAVDWDATLRYRHYLWSYGLGVAEAMDTAQRGNGLDWTTAQELIKRSVAEAKSVNGLIACGAGTDHLPPGEKVTIDDCVRAYEEQIEFVEGCGGRVILMASRALAGAARGAEDYERVYRKILSQTRQPVILHWLGEMFDPQLAGYWGTSDTREAMRICLEIINENAAKIDGIKISLLSAEKEIEMRRLLPASVKMYTGDDFNYDRLIWGDARGFSHALLGIFDAIAPAAANALQALDHGDRATYDRILAATVPLSRHIFQTPTYAYKTGIVFLAYLNGHQTHFRMIGAAESWRSAWHCAELFRLADAAGLFVDAEQAARRMKNFLLLVGVE